MCSLRVLLGNAKTLDPGLRRDDGGNSDRIQVMKLFGEATVKFLPSSRRKPGSSVFHRAPDEFDIDKYEATERLSLKIR
jgi:hypothetical protein